MGVRARASSVIVHRVAPRDRDAFVAWQNAIADAASTFDGYQETDLYPPSADEDPWVVVIHFDDAEKLRSWIDSPLRAEWVARYGATTTNEFELKNLPRGLGDWFTQTRTPSWKTMATVLCGLYPTVLVLAKVLGPHTSRFGFAVSMLIGNLVSVCLMDWAVMPALTKILGPWLRAKDRKTGIYGLVGVLAAVAVMTAGFRYLWG